MRVLLAACAALLALATAADAACVGRYVVRGAPLFGHGGRAEDLLDVSATTLMAAEGGCGDATLAARGAVVVATWPACPRAKLVLRARRGCARLAGTLRVRHRRRRVVADRLSPADPPVVPRPTDAWGPDSSGGAFVDSAATAFVVTTRTRIVVEPDAGDVRAVATLLADLLHAARSVRPLRHGAPPAHAITLSTRVPDPSLGDEGYALHVDRRRVVVRANTAAGLLHGVETVRQLLPVAIESGGGVPSGARLPALHVRDVPRFAWRGFMLDTSRTFLPTSYVLATLERMALLKMNVLHLHLSDDQGWRLVSDAYPPLDTLGSQFDPVLAPHETSGFYAAADVAAILARAAALHVTVVPELDMPGHTLAMLHALPELACTTSPDQVRTADEFPILPQLQSGVFIHDDVLCVCDPHVLDVAGAVIAEAAHRFPGGFVHAGGDEVPTTAWESSWRCPSVMASDDVPSFRALQARFTRRLNDVVRDAGKRMVVWDDALAAQAGAGARFQLDPDVVVMRWRSFEAEPPALWDHDVVQSPFLPLYFDYPSVPLAAVYAYDPAPPGLDAAAAAHVLGPQANMWTWAARDLATVDRQVYPKLLAVAEMGWTPQARRTLDGFTARLAAQQPRLDALGIAR